MQIKGLEKWGDKVLEEKLSNGNTLYYVERNRMYFDVGVYLGEEKKLKVYDRVDEKLMRVLYNAYLGEYSIRLWYGDIRTGRSWNADYHVTGRVGRATGKIKIPILVYNKRCYGGTAISTGSIIRIDDIEDKRTLWSVPDFHVEPMEIKEVDGNYPYAVMQTKDDGTIQNIANFKEESSAKRWVDFMTGKRYSK